MVPSRQTNKELPRREIQSGKERLRIEKTLNMSASI
jgi:hypothetical protein